MPTAAPTHVSYADYLAALAVSATRLEWHAGEIRAMPGGSVEHARLQGAVVAALASALRDRRCAVFPADLRVRVTATDRTFFPDVTVVCERREHDTVDPEAITNPTVVIEIVSESSEAYDRGEKFRHYRQVPSLQEYVLISQHEPLVEVYRRVSGEWRLTEAGSGGSLALPSLGVELEVDALYRDPLA